MRVIWNYICKSTFLKLCCFVACSITLTGCAHSHIDSNGNATPTLFAFTDWKYGYFCGKNHPSSPKPYQNPKDEIDAACKEHDKCWERQGENNGPCNDVFLTTIKKLNNSFMIESNIEYHNFMNTISISDFMSPNVTKETKIAADRAGHLHRCVNVTHHIMTAFTTVFVPSMYRNQEQSENDFTFKSLFTATMIIPITVFESLDMVTDKNFPSDNETCYARL